MPEIRPNLSDTSCCISVHWSLPVQCVLPRGHRDNFHEAWHPQTGNRLRYRRSGIFVSEELRHDQWHDLRIPPPGGHCGDVHKPGVRCTQQYGHPLSWQHRAIVKGCTYSWSTPRPRELTKGQLSEDVRNLRAAVYRLTAERDAAVAALDALAGDLAKLNAEPVTA